jgi:hypothetical protein
MRSWSRPGRCSAGCGTCRRGPGCTSCSRWACSRGWDTPGYGGKLTAGLAGLDVPCPSEKALRDLRRRLGTAPFKALFEIVAGPLAWPHTPGVSFAGLRTVAFDGLNSLKVPDTDRNRSWIGRIRYRMGFAGYPTLRLMALAETGTVACSVPRSARPPTGTRLT